MGCSDILLESIVDWQPHLLPFWFTTVMAPRPRFPQIAPSQRLSTKQVQQAHFWGHGIYLMITMTQKLSVFLAETFLELWYSLKLFWPIPPSFPHPFTAVWRLSCLLMLPIFILHQSFPQKNILDVSSVLASTSQKTQAKRHFQTVLQSGTLPPIVCTTSTYSASTPTLLFCVFFILIISACV